MLTADIGTMVMLGFAIKRLPMSEVVTMFVCDDGDGRPTPLLVEFVLGIAFELEFELALEITLGLQLMTEVVVVVTVAVAMAVVAVPPALITVEVVATDKLAPT